MSTVPLDLALARALALRPKLTKRSGNQVVVAGNTMLSDDHIKKLVVLRMNREFMKFMRREYPLILESAAVRKVCFSSSGKG